MTGRALHLVRKIRGKSARELAGRSRLAASALIERWLGVEQGVPSFAALRARLTPDMQDRITSPGAWRDDMASRRRTAPPMAGLEDPAATAAAVRAFDSESHRLLMERAELVMQRRFPLLGLAPVSIPAPIDWQRDPISGERAPTAHWATIDYLNPAVAGDHKVVWELNRHHVLVTLGQAYAASGDERFAATAASWMRDWLEANPPKRGVNWASSLEVAYRSIAWVWTLALIRRSGHLTPELFSRSAGMLYRAARHLCRFPSTYFSPNTHLTGEALGLMYIATSFPEFRESARWARVGWQILTSELPRQVHADGTYFEQSTWYHRYTFDIYAHALCLAESLALPGTREVEQGVRALVDVLHQIMRPDGTVPVIGDDDGGRLLFLDGRSGLDVRPALALGAARFGRGDLREAASGAVGELLWMHGEAGLDALARARPAPPTAASRYFADGGMAVLRDHWRPDGSVLVFDAGRHGAMNCGHAHADALAFDLTVRGTAVFVDPGTYTYTGDLVWRDRFRHTLAHNTVSIDGGASSEPAGTFSWRRISHPVFECWEPTPGADYVRARQDWSTGRGAEVRHVREILAVPGVCWVIRDAVGGEGRHEAVATFQCSLGIEAEEIGGVVTLSQGGRKVALMAAFDRGMWSGETGWVAPVFGRREPAVRLRRVLPFDGAGELLYVVLAPSYTVVGPSSPGEGAGIRVMRIQGEGVEYLVELDETAGQAKAGLRLRKESEQRIPEVIHSSRGAR